VLTCMGSTLASSRGIPTSKQSECIGNSARFSRTRRFERGNAETLYAGVKPLQLRIYNKTEERLHQWRHQARLYLRNFPDGEPIPFECMFGHSEHEIITRVERQIAGRDIQKLGFSDFKSLQLAPFVSPFEKIVFYEPEASEPSIEEYGFLRWTSGMYLREKVQVEGVAETRAFMKNQFGRNFYREAKIYEPFLHLPSSGPCIDAETLLNLFQRSAIAQIPLPHWRRLS
jgi:hypothetical protein